MAKKKRDNIALEESLHDDWGSDLAMREVPIGGKPFLYLGIATLILVAAVAIRIVSLNASGSYYAARAMDNITAYNETPAPRGLIISEDGKVLADNNAAFAAILDAKQLAKDPTIISSTEKTAQDILGISPDNFSAILASSTAEDFATPIVLAENISQAQLVELQAAGNTAIKIQSDFARNYPGGAAFSSVLGYVGRPTDAELKNDPSLDANSFVGKAGIEAEYDNELRGTPGYSAQYENSRGQIVYKGEQTAPEQGKDIHLTIDAGFQEYFYQRMQSGLAALGRTVGLGIAMDPKTGAILALVNLPGYDNNVFSKPASTSTNAEIENLFTSPDKPLFDRAIAGYYNPGSTIKPLDGVGALVDGVITPDREIFSPGYIMIPNPYDTSTPTKYLDWQYQGSVDLSSALAQSSDVYFYIVGGGSPAETTPLLNDPSDYGIAGLGMDRLHQWWQAFGLGKPTGIDLPGEASGFLPTPAWKESHTGTPWLLGDTYNVSIGQGNLLLSPIQLIDYISAIANGGTVWKPFLNAASTPAVNENLTQYASEIAEVQKGMRAGVNTPRGTAYKLNDLPFQSCAKTGSAQIKNNTEENALFVGYAPCNDPQIALLILVENSKQGSLNAVPIAKDVMNWYYENRIAGSASGSDSSSSH